MHAIDTVRAAWIVEPRHMMPSTYEHAVRLRAEYDIIFTHVRELAARYPETFRFCPFATTHLRHWQHRMYPKSKLLSIIASTKGYHVEGGGMQGHRLRHEAIRRLGPTITGVYAKGYQHAEKGWHTNKIASLRDYMFAIVIENQIDDCWFTEKLIDAFLTGTLPTLPL